jgi:diguanylate cyclase (GGDEF)-like protein/PAS domain S-box-containing protein
VSELIREELETLRQLVGAAAVVLWEVPTAVDHGFVAAAVPPDLVPRGMPWPAASRSGAAILVDHPRKLGTLLPTQLRLALPRPAVAVWSTPLPDPAFGVCVVWSDPPGERALAIAAEETAGDLARRTVEYRMRERLANDSARLTTVLRLLDQAIVAIDDLRGQASLNAAAARLLGLPEGIRSATEASTALHRLQVRALDARPVEEVERRLRRDPRAEIDGVIWTFAETPTHLRVTSSPIEEAALSGRVWVFDDVSEQLRALAAVEEAQAHYRMLAENASDIVFRGSPDGVLEWVSESVGQTLGWSAAEMIGRQLTQLVHPEDVPVILRAARQTHDQAGGGGRVTYRARFTCRDGTHRWMEVSARGVVDDEGRVIARIGSAHDVDEQVRTQRALELSEARLRASADGMLDPQVLLGPVRDAQGAIVDFTYLEVNRATCEYLSMTRGQLIGMSLLAASPGVRETGLFDLYLRAMLVDEPVVVDDFLYDNEILGLTRWYEVRASRVGDELSLTWRDVTDRHEAQMAVAASEERYRLLAENATDVVGHARRGEIVWMSPSAEDAFGVPAEDWIGCRTEDLLHPDDSAVFATALPVLPIGEVHGLRLRMRAPGRDTYHWVEARTRQYVDSDGKADGLIASMRIIDELVKAEAELDHRARFDALTGLANRAEAMARFDVAAHRARRTGDAIAVLFCDVDLFKSINDQYGHAAGDAALGVLADRISRTIRTDDLAARVGGDEFLVLLVGVHGLDDAVAVAEKVRTAADHPIPYEDVWLRTSLSVGVALARPGEPMEAIMARADSAMYEAKRAGRDQVVAIPE